MQANHGAEKLPYYTANFHMEYGMACKLRGGNLRDEEARALRYRTLHTVLKYVLGENTMIYIYLYIFKVF